MTDIPEPEVDTSLPSPLSDLTNVELKVVEEPATGMSPENAYRHLAGLPPEPVDVPEEI